MQYKVAHDDHGLTKEQSDYIARQVYSMNPNGFFIQEVNLPERLGTVPNALYGTEEGDNPISEDEVFYASRANGRGWKDRFVRRPLRQTSRCQAIGITQEDGSLFFYTIYGGALAPQHPEDPNNRDVAAAKRFWSAHALSHELLK